MKKINEDINFNPKAIKLKGGEGDWFALYQNGRLVYESNRVNIINKLKSVTTYTNEEINQLLNDSLSTWITLDKINLSKLKQEYLAQMPFTKLRHLVDTILESKFLNEELPEELSNYKITNPETGNKIKISTALSYDTDHPAHKLAQNVLNKIEKNKKEISNPKMLDDKLEKLISVYDTNTDKREEIGIYIDILKLFQKTNTEENKKKAISLFNVKDENELQSIIGDGSIIGMKIKPKSKGSFEFQALTDDGFCDRTIDVNDKSVHMNYFRIDPSAPKGSGSKMFANQLDSFRKMGLKKLHVTAGGNPKDKTMNGYYTWARLGYNFSSDLEKKKFKKLIKSSNDPEINNVNSLHVLMSFEKGRQFWKENGFGFDGEFDLNDGSPSMLILNKYREEQKNKNK